MEASKRDYIDKLKNELDNIEEKWLYINNENCMIGEDYRSKAMEFVWQIKGLNQVIQKKEEKIMEKLESIENLEY